jgi:hypothetical protein
VKEVNEFMQNWRVLCVTTHRSSERMWANYAEDHKGIALRVEPNVNEDSKLQCFRPVVYLANRPPLHENTQEFLAACLFGDKGEYYKSTLEKIIYAKTLEWQHEGEYRLAIPLQPDEEPWNTLAYYPEEITELYLGAAMADADRSDILEKANALNPRMAVFQAALVEDGKIIFKSIKF